MMRQSIDDLLKSPDDYLTYDLKNVIELKDISRSEVKNLSDQMKTIY